MAQRMEDSMMGEDVDPSVEFLYKTMCKVIFIQAETTLMVVALLNLQACKLSKATTINVVSAWIKITLHIVLYKNSTLGSTSSPIIESSILCAIDYLHNQGR